MRNATLVFPIREGLVLLGMKKAGFGAGKYNGFGGKVEPAETIVQAALRELREEVGIQVNEHDACHCAVLCFRFPPKPEWDQVVHVFIATRWVGEPVESREMVPEWFPITDLPFAMMWHDDRYWLPLVLAGKRVAATFVFGDDNETVIDAHVEETGQEATSRL